MPHTDVDYSVTQYNTGLRDVEVGMETRITVYPDSDGPDLKGLIARLNKRRDLPYYRRSESKIAAMLLQERIEQVLDGEVGDTSGGA